MLDLRRVAPWITLGGLVLFGVGITRAEAEESRARVAEFSDRMRYGEAADLIDHPTDEGKWRLVSWAGLAVATGGAVTYMAADRFTECPHCRGRVPADATACRHCGRDLVA